MNYGVLMKDIREDHDLTQEAMAKILGIARSSYKQFELQYDMIPLKYLIAFCNYFSISLDYIFGFTFLRSYKNIKKEINLKDIG